MNFKIDATLPASAAQLWAIFFDVQRVAGLIPGCRDVVEVEPLKRFSALMTQKIGPFKLELPTIIVLGACELERHVELSATGRDKATGTSIDVRMTVHFEERQANGAVECALVIDADMQVAGRLASLGYPVVKKRSEELFGEFERRLRNELVGFGQLETVETGAAHAIPAGPAVPASVPDALQAAPVERPRDVPAPRPPGGVEIVLQWPRVGISVAVACVVAYAATTAFQQSPGWWVVAPLLGVAAGLGRRAD